jgi:DNA polymerase-3 subunit epsilon
VSGRQIIVVDVETNGLDHDRHQAVEVAWWNLNTDERGLFIPHHDVQRVLGAADIEALRVNRYIDRVAGHPQDLAHTELLRLHDQLVRYDEAGDYDEHAPARVRHALAGSNPASDARFLTKLFGQIEYIDNPEPWHHRLWDLSAYAAGVLGLDTLPGLATVCELLDVPAPDHSAEADVTATGICFTKLMLKAGTPL